MQTQVTACGTLQPTFVVKVDLARNFVTEVLEGVEQFGDVYGTKIDEVENRSRDGFIAFTDGGFDGWGYATLRDAQGSGAIPTAVQGYVDQALKDAEQAWDEKHPEATVEMIYADPEPVALEMAGQLALPGLITKRDDWQRREHPIREKWHEFEDEHMSEGGTYFYKVRVLFYDVDNSSNVTGKPEAYFFVGINTDFEYGRDNIPWLSCYGQKTQQSQWLWEKNVALDDLTEEFVEQMVTEAVSALQGA